MGISRAPLIALLGFAGCASGGGRLPDLAGTPLALVSPEGSQVPVESLWRDRAATVLVFWSRECPCVRRYQSRVDQLLDRYPAERVRVLGVSSNAGEAFDEVLMTARTRGVRIPIFRDEGGRVAQAVGVHSTPTVAVVDGQGRVRFMGWIDNERMPGEPGREAWLEQALDGLLENRPFPARTPIYGCTITRSLFPSSSGHCCHDQH